MRIYQTSRSTLTEPGEATPGLLDAQLLLVFASTDLLQADPMLCKLRDEYPEAFIFGCSTAGEIMGTSVRDDTAAITAIRFDASTFRTASAAIGQGTDAGEAGKQLAAEFPPEGLVHVLVLSDGINVNGSELVRGLASALPAHVSVTGGLSGDGDRFKQTYVIFNGEARSGCVGAIGLYGDKLRVGCGSLGGWDSFGPERLITRSDGNVLYELDGKSALDLYKRYLGESAAGLPATGLLFPLSMRINEGDTPVVRTILGVDEQAQSMIFAGDMPVGAFARLMKANFDRLVDGAYGAALTSKQGIGGFEPELALLVSCVGRKMVLKQRTEEEVEAVREVLGEGTAITGFYSYGEISPFTPNAKCELHNQTMTITTLAEIAA